MVLANSKQPRPGNLTPFHKLFLPSAFLQHVSSTNEPSSWDNGYMPLFSANAPETALWARILAAVFGAIALLVPMLIMTVNHAPVRNLVTTSAAVGIVAVVLAVSPIATWRDVLGVTAAYAAVLVVFIGTSSSGF